MTGPSTGWGRSEERGRVPREGEWKPPLSPGFQKKRKFSCSSRCSPPLQCLVPKPGMGASPGPHLLRFPGLGSSLLQGPSLTCEVSAVLSAFRRPPSSSAPTCSLSRPRECCTKAHLPSLLRVCLFCFGAKLRDAAKAVARAQIWGD